MRLPRREFALASLASLVGCQRRSEAATTRPASIAPPGARGATRLLEWTFDAAISPRTAVLVPDWGAPEARFPVLVALHGRGEARKSPAEGALGWPRDYALVRAVARVSEPPLQPVDFEGYVDGARLRALNRKLTDHPFEGLIIACPYVPDLDAADDGAVLAVGSFVREILVPRVRRETRALAEPAATSAPPADPTQSRGPSQVQSVSFAAQAVAFAVHVDAPVLFGSQQWSPAMQVRFLPPSVLLKGQ